MSSVGRDGSSRQNVTQLEVFVVPLPCAVVHAEENMEVLVAGGDRSRGQKLLPSTRAIVRTTGDRPENLSPFPLLDMKKTNEVFDLVVGEIAGPAMAIVWVVCSQNVPQPSGTTIVKVGSAGPQRMEARHVGEDSRTHVDKFLDANG